jgi:ATP-dependent RNA helicase DDX24/MAK5
MHDTLIYLQGSGKTLAFGIPVIDKILKYKEQEIEKLNVTESDDDKSDVEDDDESDDKSDEEDDDGSYSEDNGSGDNEETSKVNKQFYIV